MHFLVGALRFLTPMHHFPLHLLSWASVFLLSAVPLSAVEPALPDVPSAFEPRLLPGQKGVVFAMYSQPGNPEKLDQLIASMRQNSLGNGFDPGPAVYPHNQTLFEAIATAGWPSFSVPGPEMQIRGGRSVLGAEQAALLRPFEKAGVFYGIQLGEWDYYFHRMSTANAEFWWRSIYKEQFEQFQHLMKPKGLFGYDRMPLNRQECYDTLREYFTSRTRDLLDRVISVTGHSHYEAYAGEWGARCIGLELGENIAFTQSKLAFARGAARQSQKPWSVQVSPWFAGACTTRGPLRQEGTDPRDWRGLEAGHSLSFYERMWLHAWFVGAAMVTPENSLGIFFESDNDYSRLTEHGRKAGEVFRFMQSHDRGAAYTPVAVVLDRLAGYNAYMGKPWGIFEPTPGDRQIQDLFEHQLYPGSDHIWKKPDPENPEATFLPATPYGEIFDVQLTSASEDMLGCYPALLLAGDITFDESLVAKLESSLKRGHRVLYSAAHREALGAETVARLAQYPGFECLEHPVHPATGRPALISHERLQELLRQTLPVTVSGAPIQWALNRNSAGWVLELSNPAGVRKKPGAPAVIDPSAVARVKVQTRFPCESATEWRSGKTNPMAEEILVGPGQTVFLEMAQ